jgi:hypothetical protein
LVNFAERIGAKQLILIQNRDHLQKGRQYIIYKSAII